MVNTIWFECKVCGEIHASLICPNVMNHPKRTDNFDWRIISKKTETKVGQE